MERLLAGKLDWFPDVLAAVLTALEINYDDAPLNPAERALLTPSDMLRDGALLVRPVPVVEWANAAGHLDLLGADNRSVNRYWHRHDCETVLTPIGGRRDTLAFRICGVSMEPTLQDHDIILVEPALAIDDVPENKIVVARLRDVKNLDDCVVCKRFHRKSDGLLLLSSDNPNGRTITCHASNLTWLGVAVKKLSSL